MHREVRIALPITLLGITEPGVANYLPVDFLFLPERQRTQGFREYLERRDANGHLAGARSEQRSCDSDDVAEIELMEERISIAAELIPAEVELNSAGRICQVGERGFSVRTPRDNASGYADGRPVPVM